jgi:hypothetical protein
MEISGLGGGLMFAAAAGLWLVYLMPTWFKRREYLATERNAVRLQQTLRVLAETSEVPTIVRAETTAHSIATQEKVLREQRQQAEAIARSRDAAAVRTEAAAALAARAIDDARASVVNVAPAVDVNTINLPSPKALAARRLRRSRAAATLVSAAGLIVTLVQVAIMIFVGVAPGAGAVIGFSLIAAATGIAALVRLASVSRRRVAAPARAARPARTPVRTVSAASATAKPAAPVEWTPVPIPKPLYMSRAVVEAPIMADSEEQLRAAAIEAARERRAAELAPKVVPISTSPAAASTPAASASPASSSASTAPAASAPVASAPAASDSQVAATRTPAPAPVAPAVPSRFAGMGVIDPSEVAGTDLDAVLRRRRQAS